jgi:hypothetical protein
MQLGANVWLTGLSIGRAPSLLMRARALATVREWKKRLERQAHSRSIGASSRDGGDGVNQPPSTLTMLLSRHTRRCNVRVWHKADITRLSSNARFWG